jgi:hypothetical protein
MMRLASAAGGDRRCWLPAAVTACECVVGTAAGGRAGPSPRAEGIGVNRAQSRGIAGDAKQTRAGGGRNT